MKMSEMRGMNPTELDRRLADMQEELFNLRFQFATRQLTNHSRLREVRRDVARVRTLLRERELMEVEA
jgi:large subunit ribosomal protein L29